MSVICHLRRADMYARVARYTPFPLIVLHVHCVPGLVRSLVTVPSTPDMQSKDWLCLQVWLRL